MICKLEHQRDQKSSQEILFEYSRELLLDQGYMLRSVLIFKFFHQYRFLFAKKDQRCHIRVQKIV
jgi:hypothetical protein